LPLSGSQAGAVVAAAPELVPLVGVPELLWPAGVAPELGDAPGLTGVGFFAPPVAVLHSVGPSLSQAGG
jgi:hypothetical protein